MSYMSHAEFAPVAGIQDLSFDEIDFVDGAGKVGDIARNVGTVAGIAAGGALLFGHPHAAAGLAIISGVAFLVAAVD